MCEKTIDCRNKTHCKVVTEQSVKVITPWAKYEVKPIVVNEEYNCGDAVVLGFTLKGMGSPYISMSVDALKELIDIYG